MRTTTLITLLLCIATLDVVGQHVEDALRDGQRRYKAGDHDAAVEDFQRATQLDPMDARAAFNLGNAHYRNGQYDAAADRHREAARLTEAPMKQAKAWHNVGNSMLQQNKPREAVAAYKEALRRNPADEDTRYNLALAQKMLKEQEQQEQEDKQDKQDQQDDQDQDQDQKQDQQQQGDQDQEKDQQQDQQQQQQKQDQDGQPKEQPGRERMPPKEAERLLDALDRQEREVQEKVQTKLRPVEKRPIEKDW